MEVIGTISAILKLKGSTVFSVSPEATVFEAIQVMADKNVGALLILESERLVGIISERDYTRKVALLGRVSKEIKVREVITSPVIHVSPNHTVQECMRLMTDHHVRHLLVLEGDRVVGIVSIGDLVNWIISAQDAALSQMERYITGQYPP
jgi:CBS domain-containing protein